MRAANHSRNSSGFRLGLTLVELLVAMSIASVAMLLIFTQISNVNSFFSHSTSVTDIENTNLVFLTQMDRYMRRATSLATTPYPASSPIPTGFLIYGNGAVAIPADLRSCSSFAPATSPANYSLVIVSCCSKGLSLNPLAVPSGIPATTATSVCGGAPGLSIEVRNGANVVSKVCNHNYTQMMVANVGPDAQTGDSLYHFYFKTNVASTNGGAGVLSGSERNLEFYLSPGNTPASTNIFCEEVIPRSFY